MEQKPLFIAIPYEVFAKLEPYMATKPYTEVAGFFQDLQNGFPMTSADIDALNAAREKVEEE